MNEHLNKLRGYWEHIVQIDDNNFCISDPMFKVIISLSLPQSWDNFVEPFVSLQKGINDNDPKKAVRSQEFIRILTEENLQRRLCDGNSSETVNQVCIKKKLGTTGNKLQQNN